MPGCTALHALFAGKGRTLLDAAARAVMMFVAIIGFIAFIALGAAAGPARAQPYPNKPIRIVIPFAPAGSTDVIGRINGQKLAEAVGQSVIIENRPGAGGVLGLRLVAKSTPADGYTLVLSGSYLANLAVFVADLGFDPMNDFAHVATLAEIPIAIATNTKQPYQSLRDLATAAKARPGALTYGSPGVGTSAHLMCETLKLRLGVDMVHAPYKGNGPAANDLLAGHIPLVCSNLSGLPDLKGERIRILGVTGLQRDPSVPQAPTFREGGVRGLDRGTWVGFSAPKGTPSAITERLNAELNRALQKPDLIERFTGAGAVTMPGSIAEFGERLEQVRADLAELKKTTGLKLDQGSTKVA